MKWNQWRFKSDNKRKGKNFIKDNSILTLKSEQVNSVARFYFNSKLKRKKCPCQQSTEGPWTTTWATGRRTTSASSVRDVFSLSKSTRASTPWTSTPWLSWVCLCLRHPRSTWSQIRLALTNLYPPFTFPAWVTPVPPWQVALGRTLLQPTVTGSPWSASLGSRMWPSATNWPWAPSCSTSFQAIVMLIIHFAKNVQIPYWTQWIR